MSKLELETRRESEATNPLPISTSKRNLSGVKRTQTVTWNPELTNGWRSVDASETLVNRVERYLSYMNPSHEQLKNMSGLIQNHVKEAKVAHRENAANTMKFTLDHLNFDRSGVAYAIDLGSKTVVAVRVEKTGSDVVVQEESVRLTTKERDLTSPKTEAYELFEEIVNTLAKLPQPKEPTRIAFVCSFDVQIRSSTMMYLNKWSKGMQTGRETDDPAEGYDIAAMLDAALSRHKLPFRVGLVLNDLVCCGVLGMSQLSKVPDNTVRFMLNLGSGFNIGAVVLEPSVDGMISNVVDMKVNEYNAQIPRADIDLEVDWADGNTNENQLEKLVAGKFLGEIARRVIVKVFQNAAPKLAWSRGGLPTDAALRIATDESSGLEISREIIQILWDWTIDAERANYVQRICRSVFNRSSSLLAAALCAVVQENNGLVPALGGSIVAVSGELYNASSYYQTLLRDKIDIILGITLSKLLITSPVRGGSGAGAALMLLFNGGK